MTFDGNGIITQEFLDALCIAAELPVCCDELVVFNTKGAYEAVAKRAKEVDNSYEYTGEGHEEAGVVGTFNVLLNHVAIFADTMINLVHGNINGLEEEHYVEFLTKARDEFRAKSLEDAFKGLMVESLIHELFHAKQYKEHRPMFEAQGFTAFLMHHIIEREADAWTECAFDRMHEDGSLVVVYNALDGVMEKCGVPIPQSRFPEIVAGVFAVNQTP